MLTHAIDVLASPQTHQAGQARQAQAYLDQFKKDNASRLHMFFVTYYEFSSMNENQQKHSFHKFWTLTAIIDVLSEAVKCRLNQGEHPVQHMLCKSVLLDLLRSEGPKILSAEPLAIPKFAKIYILLIKLDNLGGS